METFMIFLAVIAIIVFYVIYLYNGLIQLRNRVKEAWSDIDVQLKRRYDLIPNLVETVKGYAKQEENVFTKVTEARSNAMQAKTPKDHAVAENMLQETLKSLFAVAESYPELKSNQNFAQLQTDLRDTENQIEASRRYYNGNVREFNTKIQTFPNNVFAAKLGFSESDFFEVQDAAQRENVKVDFSANKTA